MLGTIGRLSAVVIVIAVGALMAQAEPVDFARDVRPILSDACFHCHGPDEQTREADLRLDLKEGLYREQDSVTVVRPGQTDASELIRRITSTDESLVMPPPDSNRHLTPAQIDTLKRWVEQGAPWEQHWAFVPPQRPPLPTVQQAVWLRNAVDSFILSRLEQEGLGPSPEADKVTLIRRVTLDLTGLPPTPEEIDAFLADESANAYERLVDRLLASPRYGERMVWEWLDAARYADSNGYQADPERTMWPWRDWVVRALNANMPFDQFTVEQLAGDLLPGATTTQILATGFNRNHMYNGEGGRIPEETRVENVMDRAETTATVWLGVTVGYARCHDHKYDPISQADYYRFYAFFNNTSEEGARYGSGQVPPTIDYLLPGMAERRTELEEHAKNIAAALTVTETTQFPREDSKPAADSSAAVGLPEPILAVLRKTPAQRSSKELGDLKSHFEKDQPAYAQDLDRLKQAVDERDAFIKTIPQVMVMDRRTEPRTTSILTRGAYDKPESPVTAGIPEIFPALPEGAPVDRMALARWLVDPGHPLTARVAVNREWQRLFGLGLVKTAEDFGTQGSPPSHPQLLDWLATEFVASGWNVKHLQRLMLTSATYRQSSKVSPKLIERDPENRLLARGSRYRLPSWMLRDQALAVGGLLTDTVGGPSVRPYQPPGVWEEATFGFKKYVQDHGDALYRRSLYTFWRRIVGPTMFFDTANRQTCTVKVLRTNTPLHALTLLNDVTYIEAARALARRVLTAADSSPAARITTAFRHATARTPRPQELAILTARLDQLRTDFTADPEAARKLLAVGESPRAEQFDLIEHAAYTALCTLILNLDETQTRQ